MHEGNKKTECLCFTFHEMLDNLNLIHMNGRVYDPKVGRFLSADPFVQAPSHTQSFNRYSYVWNNPLSKTDPSGFWGRNGPAIRNWMDANGADNGVVAPWEEIAIVEGNARFHQMWGNGSFGGIPAMQAMSGREWLQQTAMQGFRGANGANPLDQRMIVFEWVPGGTVAVGEVGEAGEANDQYPSQVGGQWVPVFAIGFSGAGGPLSGGNPDFARLMNSLNANLVQGNFLNLNNSSQARGIAREVQSFVADNPNGFVDIFGYSRGGNTAVQLVNQLGEAGLSVSALVTIDPHNVVGSLSIEHGNTWTALNFYQQNPTDRRLGIDPSNARNPYQGSVVSGATNVLMPSSVTHLTIVNVVSNPNGPYRGQIDAARGN